MVRLTNDELYSSGYLKKYRTPVNFGNRFIGKPRQQYVAEFKKLGFDDICECEFRNGAGHYARRRMRNKWQHECEACGNLIHPHAYVFLCDECVEMALATEPHLLLSEPFYCDYCA